MSEDKEKKTVSTTARYAIVGLLAFIVVVGVGYALFFFSKEEPTPEPAATPAEASPTQEAAEAPTSAPTPVQSIDQTDALTDTKEASCHAEPITRDTRIPPVTEDDWTVGPDDAEITLIEYSDFQCPGCAGMAPVLKQLEESFGEDLRVVYRHFPLFTIHPNAVMAAEAAEAAGAQGKFWEMHDILFENQAEWSVSADEEELKERMVGYAEELGLDVDEFTDALEKDTYLDKVMASYDEAAAIGLNGTPSFMAEGIHYPAQNWGLSYYGLEAFIKVVRMLPMQYTEPPPQVIDPDKSYIATVQTEKGDVVIRLFADKTPVAVNNFVFLAQDGWYDDITFHRVIPDFMAQTGDPSGTSIGFPGYFCDNEIRDDLKFDSEGVVAYANSGPDTNGSQFFITYTPQERLDGNFTIFGEVVEGMDVLKSLSSRDPQDPEAGPGDKIVKITVEEE